MDKETRKLIKRLEYNKDRYGLFVFDWWDLDENTWCSETCYPQNLVERATYLLANKRFSALLIEYK